MMTRINLHSLLLSMTLLCLASTPAHADYTIEGSFEGCDYDKVYELTNGQFLICSSYGYAYAYRPEVYEISGGRILIGGEEYSGRIVSGRVISTQIDGEWEGCDFDNHRLMNGMYLVCNGYFYEYAYMPSVKIFVIEGAIKSISINGERKDNVSVVIR